ncbi:hypothetical protein [Pseudactinotalea sp.]|uniref:hypothetical protein n=1 Tax=Pseudactinotalea sp. TaxID=1926260 RepID=UPI003B3A3BBC
MTANLHEFHWLPMEPGEPPALVHLPCDSEVVGLILSPTSGDSLQTTVDLANDHECERGPGVRP